MLAYRLQCVTHKTLTFAIAFRKPCYLRDLPPPRRRVNSSVLDHLRS